MIRHLYQKASQSSDLPGWVERDALQGKLARAGLVCRDLHLSEFYHNLVRNGDSYNATPLLCTPQKVKGGCRVSS